MINVIRVCYVHKMLTLDMNQNITLSLDRDLLRKARVLAAERGTSVSKLLGEELARMASSAERYALAKEQALHDLEQGLRLGGRPARRDALHER